MFEPIIVGKILLKIFVNYHIMQPIIFKLVLFYVISLHSVKVTVGEEKQPQSVCKTPKISDINENFFETSGKKGWFIPLHKKLSSYGMGDAEYSKVPSSVELKAKYKNFRCGFTTIKIGMGETKIKTDFAFERANQETFTLRTNGSSLPNFQYHGQLHVSKTDNRSYALMTSCLYGKEPSWLVLSTATPLKPVVQDAIMTHLESLGFSQDDSNNGNGFVTINKMEFLDCLVRDPPVKTPHPVNSVTSPPDPDAEVAEDSENGNPVGMVGRVVSQRVG